MSDAAALVVSCKCGNHYVVEDGVAFAGCCPHCRAVAELDQSTPSARKKSARVTSRRKLLSGAVAALVVSIGLGMLLQGEVRLAKAAHYRHLVRPRLVLRCHEYLAEAVAAHIDNDRVLATNRFEAATGIADEIPALKKDVSAAASKVMALLNEEADRNLRAAEKAKSEGRLDMAIMLGTQAVRVFAAGSDEERRARALIDESTALREKLRTRAGVLEESKRAAGRGELRLAVTTLRTAVEAAPNDKELETELKRLDDERRRGVADHLRQTDAALFEKAWPEAEKHLTDAKNLVFREELDELERIATLQVELDEGRRDPSSSDRKTHYNRVVVEPPPTLEVVLLEATSAEAAGNYREALDWAKKGPKDSPQVRELVSRLTRYDDWNLHWHFEPKQAVKTVVFSTEPHLLVLGPGGGIVINHAAKEARPVTLPRGEVLAAQSGDRVAVCGSAVALFNATLEKTGAFRPKREAAPSKRLLSGDGSVYAEIGKDDKVRLWKVDAAVAHESAQKGVPPSYTFSAEPSTDAWLSQNGERLVTLGKLVTQYELTNELAGRPKKPEAKTADGKTKAAGEGPKKQTLKPPARPGRGAERLELGCFSPTEPVFLLGGNAGSVVGFRETLPYWWVYEHSVGHLGFSRSGLVGTVLCTSGTMHYIVRKQGSKERDPYERRSMSLARHDPVAVALNADGSRLAVLSKNGAIWIYPFAPFNYSRF